MNNLYNTLSFDLGKKNSWKEHRKISETVKSGCEMLQNEENIAP